MIYTRWGTQVEILELTEKPIELHQSAKLRVRYLSGPLAGEETELYASGLKADNGIHEIVAAIDGASTIRQVLD